MHHQRFNPERIPQADQYLHGCELELPSPNTLDQQFDFMRKKNANICDNDELYVSPENTGCKGDP